MFLRMRVPCAEGARLLRMRSVSPLPFDPSWLDPPPFSRRHRDRHPPPRYRLWRGCGRRQSSGGGGRRGEEEEGGGGAVTSDPRARGERRRRRRTRDGAMEQVGRAALPW